MAENYELGLYNAQVVEALMCSSTGTDKDTGMEIEKNYLHIRVRLLEHLTKTGERTELEAQPEVQFRKYLTGGALEGKAGEITLNHCKSLGGELFDAMGFDAFIEPNNKKLEGREVQVLASKNEQRPQYRNWELFVPGAAAPKTPASRAATSILNAKFGLKPVAKKPAGTVAKAASTTVDTPESFV